MKINSSDFSRLLGLTLAGLFVFLLLLGLNLVPSQFINNKLSTEFNKNTSTFFNEKLDKNIFLQTRVSNYLLIHERSAEIFCEIKGYDFTNKFTIGLNGEFLCTKDFLGEEKAFLNGFRYIEISHISHSFPLKCLETVYLKDVECKSKLEGEI